MDDSLTVDVTLSVSKEIPVQFKGSEFYGYVVTLPSPGNPGARELLVTFSPPCRKGVVPSWHPEREAELIREFLAFYLDARVRIRDLRVTPSLKNKTTKMGSLHTRQDVTYFHSLGTSVFDGIGYFAQHAFSLGDTLGRQLFREFRSYAFSLEFIPSDVTFAFFLLCVAVECLSSRDEIIPHLHLEPDGKSCERFCRFIATYLPRELKAGDEQNDALLRELLKTIYYSHRSGFVHGGKDVSEACILADRASSSYFAHYVNGKETRTPGIGWFARVVRGAVLGYVASLEKAQPGASHGTLIQRLATDGSTIHVKVAHKIAAGDPVTFDDIHFR